MDNPGHCSADESSADEKLEERATSQDDAPSQPPAAASMRLPHEIAFIALICCAQFATQAGLTQCLFILSIIGDAFGVYDPGSLSWLISSYSLTVGTFILMAGRFGDVFGHKRMLIVGFAWFAVWSLVAGLSVYSNEVLFNFARAFQGIGPAIVLPNSLAVLGYTYPPGPRKNLAFSLFAACAPAGAVCGGAFAGLFSLAWWPWTFHSFAIALGIVAVLTWLVVPPGPEIHVVRNWSIREYLVQLDVLGGVLGVLALVLFNFAWNQAPVVGWQQPYVYVTLILGLIGAAVFFFYEVKKASYPLLPFHALSTEVGFILVSLSAGWASFGIWIFYTARVFQTLRGATPLQSVAYYAPVAPLGALASLTTAYALGRLKPAWLMVMALTAFTVGLSLIGTTPVHQTYWLQSFLCMMIIPFGMDMSFPASTLILSNAVSREHQGIAASMVATVVNYSISLGLGFAGTVQTQVQGDGHDNSSILRGYRGAYYVGIGSASMGLLISLGFLIKELLLQRKKARCATNV